MPADLSSLTGDFEGRGKTYASPPYVPAVHILQGVMTRLSVNCARALALKKSLQNALSHNFTSSGLLSRIFLEASNLA